MRTTITLITVATSLALNFGLAYAADTSVPGATNSTPGAESKGNPIPPPDEGTAGMGKPYAGEIEPGGTPPGGTKPAKRPTKRHENVQAMSYFDAPELGFSA